MAPKTLRDLQEEHRPPPEARHRHAARVEAGERAAVRNYVRDIVLGFNDGLVSVYAVVAGVVGAAFASREVAIAGIAAASAGALAMGLGEYLSTKSQAEYYASEAARERQHIRSWPDLERIELREMLETKGFSGEVLDKAVDAVASDEDRFVEFMMREEFGVGAESGRNPIVAMGLIMVAFVVGSVLPVAPFLAFPVGTGLVAATGLSLAGLFAAGWVKAAASGIARVRSGLEMAVLGAVAAAITYGVGRLVGTAV
ncbi:MAG: VIT1/CCC1 transporter family protein [Methanobacteriota archaeon]